jgi:hypothetical protein
MLGKLPNLIWSHVPMKILLFSRNKKELKKSNQSCFLKGRFWTRAFSWGSGTPSSSHPWVPLPHERTHSTENLPCNITISNSNKAFMCCWTSLSDMQSYFQNSYKMKLTQDPFCKQAIWRLCCRYIVNIQNPHSVPFRSVINCDNFFFKRESLVCKLKVKKIKYKK